MALPEYFPMKFRRIDDLPPYVFATVDQLKRELRRDGRDVIDLGFGNPDIPSPPIAVEKLREAAAKPVNHRYSASRGLPQLRQAVAELYERASASRSTPTRRWSSTIGAKEGLAHLMWVLVESGDTAVVPTPATRSTGSPRLCRRARRDAARDGRRRGDRDAVRAEPRRGS